MTSQRDLEACLHDISAPVSMLKMLLEQVRAMNSDDNIECLIARAMPMIEKKISEGFDAAYLFKDRFSDLVKESEECAGDSEQSTMSSEKV